MKFLLPFFALFFSTLAEPPKDIITMPPFAVKIMKFMNDENPGREIDQVRVGCYMLFCHIDDANSCVHAKRIGCHCSQNCTQFSKIYTRENMRPKTKTIWKEPKECVSECVLLLSKRDNSDNICTSLCTFHFSYPNSGEYQKNVMDTFEDWFTQSPLRLI